MIESKAIVPTALNDAVKNPYALTSNLFVIIEKRRLVATNRIRLI